MRDRLSSSKNINEPGQQPQSDVREEGYEDYEQIN
jgi:hypothetical protein